MTGSAPAPHLPAGSRPPDGAPSRRGVLAAGVAGALGSLVAPGAAAGAAAPTSTLGVLDVHAFAGPSGVVDRAAVRAALQAAAGGGTVYFRPGRYRFAVASGGSGAPAGPPRIADLPSGVGLWFDQAEIELVGPPTGEHCAFHATGATDVTVRGARIVGTGTGAGRGLLLVGCERVTVLDSAFSGFSHAAIDVVADASGRASSGIAIEGCHLSGGTGAGLRLAGTRDVVVTNTTAGRLGDPVRPFAGVLLDGRAAANEGVTLLGCHLEANHVGLGAIGEANGHVVVVACTLAENGTAVQGAVADLHLVANSIHRNAGPAISIPGGDRVVVEANAVSHCGGGVAVAGPEALVVGNVLYNCGSGVDAGADALVTANAVNGSLG